MKLAEACFHICIVAGPASKGVLFGYKQQRVLSTKCNKTKQSGLLLTNDNIGRLDHKSRCQNVIWRLKTYQQVWKCEGFCNYKLERLDFRGKSMNTHITIKLTFTLKISNIVAVNWQQRPLGHSLWRDEGRQAFTGNNACKQSSKAVSDRSALKTM